MNTNSTSPCALIVFAYLAAASAAVVDAIAIQRKLVASGVPAFKVPSHPEAVALAERAAKAMDAASAVAGEEALQAAVAKRIEQYNAQLAA